MTSIQARRTTSLAIWTGGWVLATALLSFGPRFLWLYNEAATLVALALQVAVGIGMLFSLRQQVRSLDELQQKIQLEAAATTLAIGLIFAGSYQMLQDVRLLGFTPTISHLMIVLSIT